MTTLKVIVLVEWLEYGGAERQAAVLAHVLQKNFEAQVELLALRQRKEKVSLSNNKLVSFCDELGVNWRICDTPMPYDWLEWIEWLPKFGSELKHAKPDVLLPFYSPNIPAGLLWRLAGAKTCIWGQRDEGRYRPPNFIEQIAVNNTPWFVSNSSNGISFLSHTLKINKDRISQIKNGVYISAPQVNRSQWREKLGLKPNQILTVMIANLHKYKDHASLIKAWQTVQNSTSNFKDKPILALAGYPYDTAEELLNLSQALNLSDSIIFLGPIDDVSGLLNAADICVHSSIYEGIPNAVLEAMACNLPVIATDIQGCREALGDEENEWLVPPKNPDALAHSLLKLIENEKLRKKIGNKNRFRIEEYFGTNQLGHNYHKIISNALILSKPWSLTGWLLSISGVINFLLATYKSVKYLEKDLFLIKKMVAKKISKTPLLWRLLK